MSGHNINDPRNPNSPFNVWNWFSPWSITNPYSPHWDPQRQIAETGFRFLAFIGVMFFVACLAVVNPIVAWIHGSPVQVALPCFAVSIIFYVVNYFIAFSESKPDVVRNFCIFNVLFGTLFGGIFLVSNFGYDAEMKTKRENFESSRPVDVTSPEHDKKFEEPIKDLPLASFVIVGSIPTINFIIFLISYALSKYKKSRQEINLGSYHVGSYEQPYELVSHAGRVALEAPHEEVNFTPIIFGVWILSLLIGTVLVFKYFGW